MKPDVLVGPEQMSRLFLGNLVYLILRKIIRELLSFGTTLEYQWP